MKKSSPHFIRTRILLLSSLIAVGSLAGCGKTNFTDIEHIARAKDFQDKGDLTASVIELKGALKKTPDNAEARWLLGQIYVDLENGAAAEKELKRARELGVEPNSVLVPLGRALLQQNKAKEVLEEIQAANNAPPATLVGVLTVRGEANLALKQREAAQADLSAALEACGTGKCVDTLLALSSLEISSRNDAVKARQWLMKAIAQDPKNGKVWRYMGDLEQVLNHPQEALDAYTKSVQANSRDLHALAERAHMNLQLGKVDASKADLETLRKLSPKYPAVQYLEGRHALIRKEAAQAQALLEAFLKTTPSHHPAIYYLAIAHAIQGQLQQANDLLVRLLNAYPGSTQTRTLLAKVQIRRDAIDDAIKTLEPIAKQTPENIEVIKQLGGLYLRKGDLQTGVNYLQQAAAAEPDSTATRLELGQALQAQGKTDLALAQFDAALKLKPDLAEAEVSRIFSYLREKNFDAALQAVAVFKGKNPKDPVSDSLAAVIYLDKKDYPKARQSLEQSLALDPKYLGARVGLARIALLQNDVAAARQHYQAALKQDDGNLDSLLGLADLDLRANKPKDATVWAEKAMQKHPKALEPALLLIYIHLKQREVLKALALARGIQLDHADNPSALQALAQAQIASGETSSALSTLQLLIKKAPASPIAHFLLAGAQIKAQDPKAAIINLNKALKLDPGYIPAALVSAELELSNNRPQEALRIARQVQQQKPTATAGYEIEGNTHMQTRAYVSAVKAYTAAYQRGQNGELVEKLFAARKLSGDSVGAYQFLTQWLAAHPNDAYVRVVLASNYKADGKRREAIEQYQVMLEKYPKNFVAPNNLAWIYQEQDDPRALEYAEKAYNLAKDQPTVVDTYGWILVERGQVKRGLELLQQAVAQAPDAPDIRYHLAAALAKAGQGQEARKELEQLLAKTKNFPEAPEARKLLVKLQHID